MDTSVSVSSELMFPLGGGMTSRMNRSQTRLQGWAGHVAIPANLEGSSNRAVLTRGPDERGSVSGLPWLSGRRGDEFLPGSDTSHLACVSYVTSNLLRAGELHSYCEPAQQSAGKTGHSRNGSHTLILPLSTKDSDSVFFPISQAKPWCHSPPSPNTHTPFNP